MSHKFRVERVEVGKGGTILSVYPTDESSQIRELFYNKPFPANPGDTIEAEIRPPYSPGCPFTSTLHLFYTAIAKEIKTLPSD
jgi:hypothetical protein